MFRTVGMCVFCEIKVLGVLRAFVVEAVVSLNGIRVFVYEAGVLFFWQVTRE